MIQRLGVIDGEVLCVWLLQNIVEHTDRSCDKLFEKFGRRVLTLILSLTETKLVIDTNDNSTLSLTKKRTISKKQRQKEYGMKIKESELDAKLIKLCDISANLSELKNQVISKSKKRRILRELRYYLLIIEKDLVGHVKYPQVITLLEIWYYQMKVFSQLKNII